MLYLSSTLIGTFNQLGGADRCMLKSDILIRRSIFVAVNTQEWSFWALFCLVLLDDLALDSSFTMAAWYKLKKASTKLVRLTIFISGHIEMQLQLAQRIQPLTTGFPVGAVHLQIVQCLLKSTVRH